MFLISKIILCSHPIFRNLLNSRHLLGLRLVSPTMGYFSQLLDCVSLFGVLFGVKELVGEERTWLRLITVYVLDYRLTTLFRKDARLLTAWPLSLNFRFNFNIILFINNFPIPPSFFVHMHWSSLVDILGQSRLCPHYPRIVVDHLSCNHLLLY